jgi:general secretion pathway protein M
MSEGTRLAWAGAARAMWGQLAARERRGVAFAAAALALLLLWFAALRPALQTLREAPLQLATLASQLQAMQVLAAEARELRAAPRLSAEQAGAALKAATEPLGEKARLSFQGERVTVVFSAISPSALRDWLQLVRSSARARPLEATLARAPQGLSGTLVLGLGGRP